MGGQNIQKRSVPTLFGLFEFLSLELIMVGDERPTSVVRVPIKHDTQPSPCRRRSDGPGAPDAMGVGRWRVAAASRLLTACDFRLIC